MAFKGKKRCHLSCALIARCQLSLLAFGLRNDYLQILACSQHLLFFVFFFFVLFSECAWLSISRFGYIN